MLLLLYSENTPRYWKLLYAGIFLKFLPNTSKPETVSVPIDSSSQMFHCVYKIPFITSCVSYVFEKENYMSQMTRTKIEHMYIVFKFVIFLNSCPYRFFLIKFNSFNFELFEKTYIAIFKKLVLVEILNYLFKIVWYLSKHCLNNFSQSNRTLNDVESSTPEITTCTRDPILNIRTFRFAFVPLRIIKFIRT